MMNNFLNELYLDVGDTSRYLVNKEVEIVIKRTSKGYTISIPEQSLEIAYALRGEEK